MPATSFKEVVGRLAKDSPAQIAATTLKVGVTIGFTTISKVVISDVHSNAAGVNV